MTKKQKIIIAVLALLFIAVLVEVGILIWPDVSSTLFPPTKAVIIIRVSNTEISYPIASPTKEPTPTEQPTPTIRIKKPTWTPYPTITPWPSPMKLATKTPNPTRIASTSVPLKPDCSAQYKYIEAVHQYNLDYINSTYNQQISYYQSLLEQAAGELDALRMTQLQRQIDQLIAQRNAAINTENSRYEADKAYLDTQCK
jgi:hypothetical protein